MNQLKNLDLGKLPNYNKVIKVAIEVQNLINRVEALEVHSVLENTPMSSDKSTRSYRKRSKGHGLDIRLQLERRTRLSLSSFYKHNVRYLLLSMALILGATDNPKPGEKGGLNCHTCNKSGHFARDCPDKRKLPKARANTATTSRDISRYCKVLVTDNIKGEEVSEDINKSEESEGITKSEQDKKEIYHLPGRLNTMCCVSKALSRVKLQKGLEEVSLPIYV